MSHASVCKGTEDCNGASSCAIAALSNGVGFKGGVDEGIRALIGADAPGNIVVGSDLQNVMALISLEPNSVTKPVRFST